MPKKKNGFTKTEFIKPESIEKSCEQCQSISEKETLLALHKQLIDLGVNRISQLENLIARAE